jgi:hypothetical protein
VGHVNTWSPAGTGTRARRYQAIERITAMAEAERSLATLRADPVAFAAACGLSLDPWQQEVMRSKELRLLLAASRQSGKSLVASCLALYTAVFIPGATVLVLSPTERQSGLLYRNITVLLAGLAAHSNGVLHIPTTSETQSEMALSNGSRIVSLGGSPTTVRGYSKVALLVLDEAAHVQNELYSSVLPMLSVSGASGRLILLSSCYGKRGIFWEAWRGPEDGTVELVPWLKMRIPASECPRIPAWFLAEQRQIMGWWNYASEYEAEFLDAKTAAFRSEDVDRAFSEHYTVWDL